MLGLLRSARGAIVAFVVVGISALSHIIAGGAAHLVSPMFVALGAVVFAVCVWLSRREWTLVRLLVLLGLAQVGLHYGMQLSGHSHLMMPANMPMPSGPGLVHDGATMVFAHAAAVIITALLLRRGERWLLALIALLRQALPVVHTDVVLPSPGPRVRPEFFDFTLIRHLADITHVVVRRGPPTPALLRVAVAA